MAEKETVERRVYNLPTELLERLRAYANDMGITSETEAARRLLDSALQMRDTVASILRQLKSRYKEERDLRVLARDVLVNHSLVKSVMFKEGGAIEFALTSDEWGKMERDGRTYTGDGRNDDWDIYPPPAPRAARAAGAAPSWEPTKTGGDLDDDIPF